MSLERRAWFVGGLGVCLVWVAATADTAVPGAHFGNFTRRGGTLKAGTYRSLRVEGVCTLTSKGTVTVRGDVVVASHGALNTLTPGTFSVRGDLTVTTLRGAGSVG